MAGEKRQITRSRISYSCQRCRQRKVKCDKVHPVCGACQKTDEECVYMSNESENQTENEPSVSEATHGTKRKQHPAASQHDPTDQDVSATEASELEKQLSRLSTLLNQLEHVAGITASNEVTAHRSESSVRDDHDILTSTSPHTRYENASQAEFDQLRQARSSIALNKGNEQQRTPNFSTISAQLERLTNLLHAKQSGVLPNANETQLVATPNELFPRSPASDPDAVLYIPTEQQRNVLFRSWLSSVYPVLPIVNPAIALIHYRTFHFWYLYGLEKGVPNPCEDHVPLIYAIYYAGVVSLSLRGMRKWFPGARRRDILRSLRKQFLQTLRAPTKLISNPPTLAARVMMYYISSSENNATGSTSTAAQLARTAHSCNLHRERPNESLDTHLAEARRRLWWEVASVDTLEAGTFNVPPTIDYRYSDTALLSVIKDSKLDTPEASQYRCTLQGGCASAIADDLTKNDQSSVVSVIYLVMEARATVARNSRHLLDINLAAKPKTKDDMIDIRRSLEELDSHINSIIRTIPAKGLPELNFNPPSRPGQSISLDHGSLYGEDLISIEVDTVCGVPSQSERWQMPFVQQYRPAMAAFHKWSRIMLSMLVDQSHCFSYAPFLSNAKSKVWVSARQCALRHAHSCLRKFNAIATDLELERFRWTWPTMYRPIYACVILLLDTYERPTSRESPRSRALFDQMLYLSSPEYGIVGGEDGLTNTRPLQESGNEVFTMLMQLRAKAWHRAGLDPLLLWTEEDQIKVGIAKPLTDAERVAQSVREDTVYSGGLGVQPDQNLLRPITEERAKERFYPRFDLIDEDEIVTPRTCVENAESPTQTHVEVQRLLRARPDQQRAPRTSNAYTDELRKQSGYAYRFRLPSELYDISELIRKIKSFQQSKRSGPNESSAALTQQLDDANNNLTNVLAQNAPENSWCSALADTQQAMSQTVDTSASTNSNQHPQPIQSEVSAQPPLSKTTTPPPTTAPQPHASYQNQIHQQQPSSSTSSAAATAAASETNPTTATATNTPRPNANPGPESELDLVNMDFDWEKWDEIFGHILDESFGNLSPIPDHDTGDDGVMDTYSG